MPSAARGVEQRAARRRRRRRAATTSLPSDSPNPPGSRKSRCMSMMTSAVRSRSIAIELGLGVDDRGAHGHRRGEAQRRRHRRAWRIAHATLQETNHATHAALRPKSRPVDSTRLRRRRPRCRARDARSVPRHFSARSSVRCARALVAMHRRIARRNASLEQSMLDKMRLQRTPRRRPMLDRDRDEVFARQARRH